MQTKEFTIVVIAAVLATGCGKSSKTNEEGPAVIGLDIADAQVCNIATDQLIPLETTDSSLLYDICDLIPTKNTWIVRSRNYLRVYDKNTGKYLYDISRVGHGAGEYISIEQCANSNDTLRILDGEQRCILEFLTDGTFLGKSIDFKEIDVENFLPANYAVESPDRSKYYLITKYNGGYPEPFDQYAVITKEGQFVKHVPGRKLLDGSFTPDRMFTDYEHNRVLAWDQLRDTLFTVSEDSVRPLYVFDFGKNKFPVESQSKSEFYLRTQDFISNEGDVPYASFIKYYQVEGDNLYFSFISCTDKGGTTVPYLAVVNEKNRDVKILHFESEDKLYQQEAFFHVFNDSIIISVADKGNVEKNPLLLVKPLDSL